MRGLTIENLVTEDNTKMESFARDILKMLSGGNSYVDGNGYLIEKGTFNHGVMVLAPLFPCPKSSLCFLPVTARLPTVNQFIPLAQQQQCRPAPRSAGCHALRELDTRPPRILDTGDPRVLNTRHLINPKHTSSPTTDATVPTP